MNSRFSSNSEAKLLLEMTKIAIHSEDILLNSLKNMVTDILWKSFRDYKLKNSIVQGATESILFIGIGIKKWLGDDVDKKDQHKLSKISQLQSNIDIIEHKMYLASKKILKEECSELFSILKINTEQGLLDAISYSMRIQIEVSKRV